MESERAPLPMMFGEALERDALRRERINHISKSPSSEKEERDKEEKIKGAFFLRHFCN